MTAIDNGNYSPDVQMIWSIWKGPGYHTRIPDGTKTHSTRESMDYALELLREGGAEADERAASVIAKVLTLQERNPTNPAYGIWPWLLEEPISEMRPPDWNWADFIGIRLCKMLLHHAAQLPPNLIAQMREALGHAGWSIFRRNVGPGYTNIAIMGAAVTLAAGEILPEPRLLEYGRARLHALLEYTGPEGEFQEYNSPNYTVLAVDECENILDLVTDPAALADCRHLWQIAWRTVAEHYHPGTGQWAGPHSRCYQDILPDGTIEKLLARKRACPPDLRDRFDKLPSAEVIVHKRFVRSEEEEKSVWGYTWLTDEVALASANTEILWHQRRPLIGYWRSVADGVAVLRARFLHDGRDFASATIRSVQERGRVLSSFGFAAGFGDFHPTLDRPANGSFEGSDFRLRYELTAPDAEIDDLGDGRYALSSGEITAVLHTLPGMFEGKPIAWSVGKSEEKVYVDAVIWAGTPIVIRPNDIGEMFLAAGVELVTRNEAVSSEALTDAQGAAWGNLRLA